MSVLLRLPVRCFWSVDRQRGFKAEPQPRCHRPVQPGDDSCVWSTSCPPHCRFARNDGDKHPRSRNASRARGMQIVCPHPKQGRREGRASAEARGPRAEKNARGRNHRYSRYDPAFPARWSSRLCALSPVSGLLATVARAMRQHRRELGISIGMPGPYDFAVLPEPFVRAPGARCDSNRPPHPRLTSHDDRETPLVAKRDGKGKHKFCKSER